MDIIKSLKNFIADSKRVLSISYKPDRASFNRTFKIVLIATLIVGILGFIVVTIIGFVT